MATPLSLFSTRGSQRTASLGTLLAPIIFFQTYLTGTVLLFAFGPWPWNIGNPETLYGFLSLAQFALLLGYLIGTAGAAEYRTPAWDPKTLVHLSLAVNLFFLLPTFYARSGSWIPDVISGLEDPGLAYTRTLQFRESNTTAHSIEYLRICFAPLLTLLLPLGTFYWSSLGKIARTLYLVSIASTIALYIAMGTNKGLAELILTIPPLVIASYLSGQSAMGRRHLLLFGSAALAGLIGMLSFFAYGQTLRIGSGATTGFFPTLGIHADADFFFGWAIAEEIVVLTNALAIYLSSGYYALALSLDKPYLPTYGTGNSIFLTRNFRDVLGIENNSYPARLEQEDGWSQYELWHTVYPWIASDVSFAGTVVVVLLVGYFFGKSWLDVLVSRNPFAVVVFSKFVIMLFYFPANNQLLQDGESLIAFLFLLGFWLLSRRRFFAPSR